MGESRQAEALALICVFTILAAILVALRAYSRYLGRNFGWDDHLIFVSLFLLLGQTITEYEYILITNTGYHVYELPKPTPAQQIRALKWSYAVQLIYHLLMGAIRASIIMFLFRVKDSRWFINAALHTVFWINVAYTVSETIVNIVQCTPVHYAYLRPIMDHVVNGHIVPGGKCINSRNFILASCALSIFMDCIIMPIPTAMVWNLQMRRKTKVAVVIIMSMGWIATAVSVGRFVAYYYRYSPQQKDRTWDIGLVVSVIEPAVGIIAACAPALRSLVSKFMPRYFTVDYSSTYQSRTKTQRSAGMHNRNLSHSYGSKRGPGTKNGPMGKDEEDIYDLGRLDGQESKEYIVSVVGGPEAQARSTKTGATASDLDEEIGPPPKHCLDRG